MVPDRICSPSDLPTLDDLIRDVIISRFELCDFNLTRTSKSLKMPVRTLRLRLRIYGIPPLNRTIEMIKRENRNAAKSECGYGWYD